MRTWGWLFASLVFSAACTKPNPAKHCTDGTCTTPNYPFCDVTGAIGGEEGTCIAVTCTAGEFGECRGDAEVRCNANGNNYDVVQCERGCDAAADGCRLCSPNETACTNGKLATCDAAGAVTSMTECPLGCFEDEPRCRDIEPSNGLATYLDMVAAPADLDLSGGATISTTGDILDLENQPIAATSFLKPAPPNGAPIRVFIARNVRLGDVRVRPGGPEVDGGWPAVAIVATGTLTVEGTLSTWYEDYLIYTAGGIRLPICTAGAGVYSLDASPPQERWTGNGGGGHATAGGRGGGIDPLDSGGAGGAGNGDPTLEPLRGGCPGGPSTYGGGGAIQLSSRVSIELKPDAVINVNGGIGNAFLGGPGPETFDGGGAGGGILLEAPTISLASGTKLLANGGPAAAEGDFEPPVSETTAVSLGGPCTSGSSYRCGNGGNGAAADGPATAGQDVPYTTTANVKFRAAGGGGGLGYVRINTATGTYSKGNDTIESAVLTTGMLKTR